MKCDLFYGQTFRIDSEKHALYQNKQKIQIRNAVKFVSLESEYKLPYLYMNIVKVKKPLISPLDTHVKAEYLKNSLSSLYWDKISDEY